VPVARELGQFADQQDEDILDEVGGVGVAQADAASPVKEQRGVELDEAAPGFLLARLAQSFEETGRRRVHGHP
jgi:hypothetical protein